jgi:hypothetical protein
MAGRSAFPAGAAKPSDASPEATALREAEEEVGLVASQVEILGRLPEYRTGTGFVITPVVGLVTPPLNLKLDDFEVAEVFEPPLEFLLDTANHQRQSLEVRGTRHEYWAMPWQGYFIWGATAGMLVTLQRMLFPGRPSDEPDFHRHRAGPRTVARVAGRSCLAAAAGGAGRLPGRQIQRRWRSHGAIAWGLGVALPAALLALLHGLLVYFQPLLAFLLGIGVLYLTMGFRQFSHFFTNIHLALRRGDIDEARQRARPVARQ